MKRCNVLLTQTAERKLSRLPNKEITKIVSALNFLKKIQDQTDVKN